MIDPKARYVRTDDDVARDVASEFLLIPLGTEMNKLGGVFVLNDTGRRIWELLDGDRTCEEICRVLVEEYAVDAATAEADTVELIGELEDGKMVRQCSAGDPP